MEGGRRAIVVGIPGVGKTTVVNRATELLEERGLKVETAVFGTFMMNEARKLGVEHRDDIRKLPVDQQRHLQIDAATTISKIDTDILFIDTHLFIRTNEGYWPGLPTDVLKALSPTNLILIEASPKEILLRRTKDKDRMRDQIGEDQIGEELNLARSFLSVCSVITSAPLMIVKNHEGHAEEAAERLVEALGEC